MVKIVMQSHVADFDAWLKMFNENEAFRTGHGATGHTVNRGVDDPNLLVLAVEFATLEGAQSFLADPALKTRMDDAGVDAPPQSWICNEVESRPY
jgi:hypothetical protein